MKNEVRKEIKTVSDSIQEGKAIATIAYLSLIGLVIAFIMNSDKRYSFATYHLRQSVGLMCTALVLSLTNIIPGIGWAVSIFCFFGLFVLWIMGLMNAINGKVASVPVLGKLYEQWFTAIH